MAAITFVLLFLFVHLTFSTQCVEKRKLELLDCSGVNLIDLPQFGGKPWVKSLDLAGNALKSVNFTLLLTKFPNLRLVDLRQNPEYVCHASPPEIKVLADCEVSEVTSIPTELPTAHYTFAMATSTNVSYFSSPSLPPSTSKVLLVSLLSCGVFLFGFLSTVLCLIWRRRRRFREVRFANPLSTASSSDNEESLYESAV